MEKSTANGAVIALGIDLAKNVFQLHGVDAAGKVVLQRAMRRKDLLAVVGRLQKGLIGMESPLIDAENLFRQPGPPHPP